MSHAIDSRTAQAALIDPLHAPDPSDETGLNATFRSTFAPRTPSSSATNISNKSDNGSSSHTTPPQHMTPPNAQQISPSERTSRSRGASLNQRHPGDMTHRPLDMLRKDSKKAQKAPHIRAPSIPGVDTIDSLDSVLPGGQYHHEGPFDATLASRNMITKMSPVAALKTSNAETLKATPKERIHDAIAKHKPLDGVAIVPPGEEDQMGRVYSYEETNLMTEGQGGDYKKIPGETLNDDQKRALAKNKAHETPVVAGPVSGEASGIELQSHQHSKKNGVEIQEGEVDDHDKKRHSLEGLKKRIGSLRKKKD